MTTTITKSETGAALPPLPELPTAEELAAAYGQVAAEQIMGTLYAGVNPRSVRELDPWTGAVHYEFATAKPSGNVNIWIRQPDGQFLWYGPLPALVQRPGETLHGFSAVTLAQAEQAASPLSDNYDLLGDPRCRLAAGTTSYPEGYIWTDPDGQRWRNELAMRLFVPYYRWRPIS